MNRDLRQEQLEYLFRKHGGKCAICGEAVVIEPERRTGKPNPKAACRFRTGSSFGKKGRRRRRILACKGCAQERSDNIQMSQDVDELRARSRRWPTVTYEAKP